MSKARDKMIRDHIKYLEAKAEAEKLAKKRRAEAGEMAIQLAKWILANFSGRLHDTRLVCEKAQAVIEKLGEQ